MPSPEFLQELTSAGAVLSSNADTVDHFGQLAEEVAALSTSAVVAPVHGMIRIVARGNDRAKFLHNFCTNNINDLPVGQACEAFFGNVQARVLGHGYILAGDGFHELWMLPGDEQAMLNHLNKYIITEDVTIESAATTTFLMLAGPEAGAIASKSLNVDIEADRWTAVGSLMVMAVTWNGQPTVFLATPPDDALTTWNRLVEGGAVPAGDLVVERHRIQAGFPRVGVDLSDGNLIPEADRDKQAISYTKGCYLGQEPIARIDAMGHVNRKLTVVALTEQTEVDAEGDSGARPVVSSISEIPGVETLGLVVVSSKVAVADEFPVAASDGRVFTAKTH